MRCQSLKYMTKLARYSFSSDLSSFFTFMWFCSAINYCDLQENKDVLKIVFGKHNLTSPITAFSRPEVSIKSQSYFFAHSVKTIAVTLTAKGITSKQVLLGTIGDQVSFYANKLVIDIYSFIFSAIYPVFYMPSFHSTLFSLLGIGS